MKTFCKAYRDLEFEFDDPRAKPSYKYRSTVVSKDDIVLVVTERPIRVEIGIQTWWTHIYLTPSGEIVHRLMALENVLGGLRIIEASM